MKKEYDNIDEWSEWISYILNKKHLSKIEAFSLKEKISYFCTNNPFLIGKYYFKERYKEKEQNYEDYGCLYVFKTNVDCSYEWVIAESNRNNADTLLFLIPSKDSSLALFEIIHALGSIKYKRCSYCCYDNSDPGICDTDIESLSSFIGCIFHYNFQSWLCRLQRFENYCYNDYNEEGMPIFESNNRINYHTISYIDMMYIQWKSEHHLFEQEKCNVNFKAESLRLTNIWNEQKYRNFRYEYALNKFFETAEFVTEHIIQNYYVNNIVSIHFFDKQSFVIINGKIIYIIAIQNYGQQTRIFRFLSKTGITFAIKLSDAIIQDICLDNRYNTSLISPYEKNRFIIQDNYAGVIYNDYYKDWWKLVYKSIFEEVDQDAKVLNSYTKFYIPEQLLKNEIKESNTKL